MPPLQLLASPIPLLWCANGAAAPAGAAAAATGAAAAAIAMWSVSIARGKDL